MYNCYLKKKLGNTKSKRKGKIITNPPKKTLTLTTDEEAKV